MHIGTNKPGTKLTRPVAMWKRVLAFIFGSGALLLALGGFQSDAGWVAFVPLAFGIGSMAFAFTKYETIG